MSSSHHHAQEPFPKGMLILAGVLVGTALSVVSVARIAGLPPAASPIAERAAAGVQALATRDLRFTDEADNSVRIVDVSTGSVAGIVAAGSETGFIRGVMRGLARERTKAGLGADAAAFRLTAWANGQLSLTDLATGRTIELNGFGTTNVAAFRALLK
ncbi:MAG: photosynthetic complex assembly protein PuhC [Sphingomonadaceae bacterium]